MTVTKTDLDHVAVAVERWSDAWPQLVGELAGTWVSGGQGPGFAPAQVRFANGMKVEVIAPHAVHVNDFLHRFLARHGPGPHHLTFKVPDITDALERAATAGYPAINIDLSDPDWKEGFLHPRHAGVVVQLAQASESWSNPAPEGFPEPTGPPAELLHVAHAVRDLDEALSLFAGVLEGQEVGRGNDEDGRWTELRWPGPGRLRLLEPPSEDSPLASWLGPLPGRVHHLTFARPGLSSPEDTEAAGTRFHLVPA